ncbi:hypothetical protein TRFO_15113 [Tritrichomonas foetus]|uniref:Uncharacterized protein n=1 Tax=Tritrichomonas foetus TaxID=1144522 RepID=A0A1J4KTK3_9EUKA|nr:hypothetical protein TRFO_15113 [Tritrichomonas foetus]|eukprot:OHT14466.1 hypothetical protein TRFO_15113 [Tritrichomonas foetus]
MSFTDVAANFLTSLLFSYSDDLSKSATKLMQTKSHIKVEGIDIYSNCLLQHGFPAIIKKGLIGTVEMNIPQSDVFTETTKILVNDIHIHAKFLAAPNIKFPSQDEMRRMREHQLQAHNKFKDTFLPLFRKFWYKWFNIKLMQVFQRTECSVKNVNISMDFGEGEQAFYLFFHIDSIFMKEPDDELAEKAEHDIFERKLEFKKFSVGFGKDNNISDTYCGDTFRNKMSVRQNTPYLLHPYDVTGIVQYDPAIPKLSTTLYNPDININLTVWQLLSFVSIVPYLRRFRNFWIIRNIPRPENDNDLCEKWLFVHRCANELNYYNKSGNKLKMFMRAFQNRQKYLKLAINTKTKRGEPIVNPEIEKFEYALSYQQVILFRYMADTLRQKWTKKSLSFNEMSEAQQFCSEDPESLFDFFSEHSLVKILFDHFNICVTHNDLNLNINFFTPNIIFEQKELQQILELSFSSFSVQITSPEYEHTIFESNDRMLMNYHFIYQSLYKNPKYRGILTANIKGELFPVSIAGLHTFPQHITNMHLENFFSFLKVDKPIDVRIQLSSGQVQFKISNNLFFNLIFEVFEVVRDSSDHLKLSLKEGSITLGSDIERVIATSISVDAIFVSDNQMVIFISPLFMNFNWRDIVNFKDALGGIHSILFDGFFALPTLTSQIDGGIPAITIAIDLPTMHSLKYINIDTIKFKGYLDNYTLSIQQFKMENVFDVQNITMKKETGDKESKINIEKVNLSFIELISYLPRDLFDVFKLKPFSETFKFKIIESKADFSYESNPNKLVFYFSTCNGHFVKDIMKLTGGVKYVEIDGNVIMKTHPFTTEIKKNVDHVDIFSEFGNVQFFAMQQFQIFLYNSEWPVERIFPKDLALNWRFLFDSISVGSFLNMENVHFQMTMSEVFFGGDISVKRMNILNIASNDKYVFSMSFDLSKHFFSLVFNYNEVHIDSLRLISMLQYFLHYPVHVNVPITIEVKIMPITIYNHFGHDTITMNIESYIYFNGFVTEMLSNYNNIQIFLNDRKICDIPYLEANGINEIAIYSPEILFQVSQNEIESLQRIIRKTPKLNFSLWSMGIVNSLPIIVEIESLNFVLNNALGLHFNNTSFTLKDDVLRCDSNFSLNLINTWFNISEIIRPASLTLSGNTKKNFYQLGVNENLNVIIRPSFVNIFNKLEIDEAPIVEIQNNTTYYFEMENHRIQPRANYKFNDFPIVKELKLINEFGEIPFKPANFANNGNMQAIFNTGQTIILEIVNNVLVISSTFEVQNDSEHFFQFIYHGKTYHLNSNTIISTPAVENGFKLDDLELHTFPSKQIVKYDDKVNLMITILPRRILIEPLYVLENKLPFNILINSKTFNANQVQEFDFFEEKYLSIGSEFFQEKRVRIDYSLKYTTEKFFTNENTKFFVRIQVIFNDGAYKIIFSPGAIFHNHTSCKSLVISEDCIHMTPLLETLAYSPNKKFYYNAFIGTRRGASFMLVSVTENMKEKQFVSVRTSEIGTVPVIMTQVIEKLPYFNIIHVHVYPYATFINNTSKKITIHSGPFSFSIQPKHTAEIPEYDRTLNYSVQVGNSERTPSFNVYRNRQRKMYLNVNRLFLPLLIEQFPNEKEKLTKIIKVNVSEIFPYRIQNATWITIDLFEKEDIRTIAPNSSLKLALQSPDETIRFFLREINETITFDPQNPVMDIKLSGIQITLFKKSEDLIEIRFVDELNPYINNDRATFGFYMNSASVIILPKDDTDISDIAFDSEIQNKNSQRNNQNNNKDSLLINPNQQIEVSKRSFNNMITTAKTSQSDVVFLLMQTYNFSFELNQVGETRGFTMILDGIKLTDHNGQPLFNSLEFNLLKLSAELGGYCHIKSMYVEILPFYFNIDLAVLSYFYDSIRSYLELRDQYLERNSSASNNMRFNVYNFKMVMSTFALALKCKTKMDSDFCQLWRALPEVLPTDMTGQEIELNEAVFDFTSSEGFYRTMDLLVRKIYFMKSCLRLVGSMTPLGAPLNYLHRVMRKENVYLQQVQLTNKYLACIGIPIGIVESILDYISSVLRLIGNGDINPKDYNSPATWGFTSLIYGVVSGILLLIKSPGLGLKNSGLRGLILGLFVGAFDLFANCGAGAVDFISGILCFLRALFIPSIDDEFSSPVDNTLPENASMQ